jgi:hypothetical protein
MPWVMVALSAAMVVGVPAMPMLLLVEMPRGAEVMLAVAAGRWCTLCTTIIKEELRDIAITEIFWKDDNRRCITNS